MKVTFFSAKGYDEEYFTSSNESYNHDIRFIEARLSSETVNLVGEAMVVCAFVNDTLNREVLSKLSQAGVKLIALRCAGYNNVDIRAAHEFGLTIVRVPEYSPNAVAEHTVCLMLSLNRKVHRAYYRVRDGNFSLEGMLGYDFAGRTMGVVGTGRIGSVVARIMSAMGMKVLAHDPTHNLDCENLRVSYVDMNHLLAKSDAISLHCPLTPGTRHMIDRPAIDKMKHGVMLINTSRGALLDTRAVIEGLKRKKIGYLGLDVYEQESELFSKDLSCEIIQDDVFERLVTFPNVLITAHQGFFTSDALKSIADTTLNNISQFGEGMHLENEVVDIG